MRTRTRILALCGAGLACLLPRGARAQQDVTPRIPNVLLMVDTSGSMEYVIPPDPTDPTGVKLVTPESPNAPAGSECLVNSTVTPSNWTPASATSNPNRWATLVSVLTGSFAANAFGCEDLQRTAPKFVSEYTLPGASRPYDYAYMLDWHRIYSNGCTLGVNTTNPAILSSQDWSHWPSSIWDYHTSAGTCASNHANCCTWTGQNNDGILDVFSGLVRFGFMSLDSFPDPSTGTVPGASAPWAMDAPGAMKGMWSYFHGWQSWPGGAPSVTASRPSGGTSPPAEPATGNPNACSTSAFYDVGARNAAAPPWEGPMIPFGNPLDDSKIEATNANIQQSILAMRPYGATPVAGLLADAYEFLFADNTPDPATGNFAFGPMNDPYWNGGCRKTVAILLTDGEPNLDLRGPTGQCDGSPADSHHPGNCPYLPADQILTNMRTAPPSGNLNQAVFTYVVGFAVSNPKALPAGKTNCAQLDVDPSHNPNDCTSPAPGLAACCALQKLAWAGSGGPTGGPTGPGPIPGQSSAFFADNPGQLKTVLAAILGQIIGDQTDRTAPVYAPPGPNVSFNAPASSYHFAASFDVTGTQNGVSAGTPWAGNLVRERYSCQASSCNGAPLPCPLATASAGDDFGANLDTQTPKRQYFTVIGNPDASGNINSDRTIRPYIGADDGFGTYKPAGSTPPGLMDNASFPSTMAGVPAALGIPNDTACKGDFKDTTAANCATYLINWNIGVDNNGLDSTLQPAPSRRPGSTYCTGLPIPLPLAIPPNPATSTTPSPPANCHLLGAIYHSTPAVVGPPHELIRDDSYSTYAASVPAATQPIMLYTQTIDGQLHAFKVASTATTDTNVEVNSGPTGGGTPNNEIWSFFPPAVLQHLLPNYNSGAANLLDGAPVIADVPGRAVSAPNPPAFERTTGSTVQWHRVLVAGGGQAGGFYYALDITNISDTPPVSPPQFLWQLSTDGAGNPIFGKTVPTPAITTVPIVQAGTRTQVAVAILPGGSGTLAPTCPTPPSASPTSGITIPSTANPNNPQASGSYFSVPNNPPKLRCWATTFVPGNATTSSNQLGNGMASTGNSITIVRLDTGQVLAHFTGTGYSGAAGNGSTYDNGSKANGPNSGQAFTAPMTGIPVAYPAGTGQIADRVYVGDADGQLWRIDFSSGNPATWRVDLAWDAYLDSSSAKREAIQTAPVLSPDPIGNVVIMFSTGEQNTFTTTATDNRVWSITETPVLGDLSHSPTRFTTNQNWMIPMVAGAEHILGPMEIFNSVLYFSTYAPPANTGVCAPNTANVWGVDYLQHDTHGSPMGRLATPSVACPPPPSTPMPPSCVFSSAPNPVIYGVAVAETPSCDTAAASTDPYFGTNTAATGASQSQFRIMWQTGAGNGIANAKVQNEVGIPHMQYYTPPPPGQGARVDSWAAIVE